jgi:hypothetical protein
VYIVDASTTGFNLPGATLTTNLPVINLLIPYGIRVEYVDPNQPYMKINTDLSSSDAADTNALMILT